MLYKLFAILANRNSLLWRCYEHLSVILFYVMVLYFCYLFWEYGLNPLNLPKHAIGIFLLFAIVLFCVDKFKYGWTSDRRDNPLRTYSLFAPIRSVLVSVKVHKRIKSEGKPYQNASQLREDMRCYREEYESGDVELFPMP